MKQTKFCYRSELESEGRAYTDVKKFLENTGVPAKILHRIMLAVSEAFTNALIHGNNYDPDKKIEIRLAVNNEAVLADVIDEGLCDVKALHNRKSPVSTDEGGRGIELIEKMADRMEVLKDDNTGGIQVSMRFDMNKYEDNKGHFVYRR
jgi:anti-sigma regulatory factor (Ser/Thr protein kinase)